MYDDATTRESERETLRRILRALEALDAVLTAKTDEEHDRANDALTEAILALEPEPPSVVRWLN